MSRTNSGIYVVCLVSQQETWVQRRTPSFGTGEKVLTLLSVWLKIQFIGTVTAHTDQMTHTMYNYRRVTTRVHYTESLVVSYVLGKSKRCPHFNFNYVETLGHLTLRRHVNLTWWRYTQKKKHIKTFLQ